LASKWQKAVTSFPEMHSFSLAKRRREKGAKLRAKPINHPTAELLYFQLELARNKCLILNAIKRIVGAGSNAKEFSVEKFCLHQHTKSATRAKQPCSSIFSFLLCDGENKEIENLLQNLWFSPLSTLAAAWKGKVNSTKPTLTYFLWQNVQQSPVKLKFIADVHLG
jgi:hypothetical protein